MTYADLLRNEAYQLEVLSSPVTGAGDSGPRLRKRAAHLRALADLLATFQPHDEVVIDDAAGIVSATMDWEEGAHLVPRIERISELLNALTAPLSDP